MSLQSQLIRLAHNVGALTADTNAIFEALRAKGVSVPADAQLSDVADMIEEIEVPITSVEIGGRSYPYVQIGNQLWLAENLDWKFSGCVIGASGTSESEPIGNYYNNDEVTYGINGNKYGLLYNQIAVNQINNLLTDGWHVPTRTDYSTLADAIGGTSIAGTKLKSISGWTSGNGTDDYGMCIVPCGDYAGTFANLGTGCSIWTEDSKSSSVGYNVYFTGDSSEMRVGEPSRYHQMSLRLVKDAPGYVTIGDHQYKTVTIGNQEWLAENLDYKFQVDGSQIPIGGRGGTTPNAWYYDNNEASYGIDGTYKCGLLYNWYAAKYLDDNKDTLLPSGWHVPTNTEWGTLQSQIGLNAADGAKLRALNNSVTSNWPSGWNGTDNYGFNSLPSGDRYYNNDAFVNFGGCADYWTSTGAGTSYYYRRVSPYGYQSIGEATGTPTDGMALRLVRDIT